MPCLPKEKRADSEVIAGFTHPDDARCTFADDGLPIGILATCCSLRGKIAVAQLDALGEADVARAMFSNMASQEAIAFAHRLRGVADDLECRYAESAEKPNGAVSWAEWNKDRDEWEVKAYSSFDEALATIRKAAHWYEKVGSLGFEVYAWY